MACCFDCHQCVAPSWLAGWMVIPQCLHYSLWCMALHLEPRYSRGVSPKSQQVDYSQGWYTFIKIRVEFQVLILKWQSTYDMWLLKHILYSLYLKTISTQKCVYLVLVPPKMYVLGSTGLCFHFFPPKAEMSAVFPIIWESDRHPARFGMSQRWNPTAVWFANTIITIESVPRKNLLAIKVWTHCDIVLYYCM